MLRTYTPITHPISALNTWLEHLICEVWCNANDKNKCEDLMDAEFKKLYEHLDWLKKDCDDIFEKFRSLDSSKRDSIIDAYKANNNIVHLCEGVVKPVELTVLPEVVQNEVKKLLELFYSRLLDIKQVPGEKLDYYNKLVKANNFNTCPVCGLANIEPPESNYIEDYDHFFPKASYPFATVNFNNLIPTCDKCNKKHKGSKKPLDHNGKAYFPFETGRSSIEITIELDEIEFDNEGKLAGNLLIKFSGDSDKNSTWNWLYNIETRYSTELKRFSFSWLRALKKEIVFNAKTADEYIDFKIDNYKYDEFDEMNFLKIALFKEIKTKSEWMAVYT